tara:strand:- start:1487 stop:1639 length:153 start_codon:yes stop_codon:yes gene_type:complete
VAVASEQDEDEDADEEVFARFEGWNNCCCAEVFIIKIVDSVTENDFSIKK